MLPCAVREYGLVADEVTKGPLPVKPHQWKRSDREGC